MIARDAEADHAVGLETGPRAGAGVAAVVEGFKEKAGAAQDPVCACCGALGVFLWAYLVVIAAVPVAAPFHGVASHIHYAVWAGTFGERADLHDSVELLFADVIGEFVADFIAPGKAGLFGSSGGLFPFGFCWQAVLLAGLYA